MTLDEAIEHAEEVARACDDSQCAADHIQLAEWLMELRIARTEIAMSKGLRNAFRAYVEKSKAENAKLRELVHDMWRDGMCDCDEFSRSIGVCVKCEYGYLERMRELGIEEVEA